MSCFGCFKRNASPSPVNNQQNPVLATPQSYQLNAYNSNHAANDIPSTSIEPVGSESIISSTPAPKTDPINLNEPQIDLGNAQYTPKLTETPHAPSSVAQEHESENTSLEKLRTAIYTNDLDMLVPLQDLWSMALNGDGYTAAHLAVSANATKILERMVDTELKLAKPSNLFGICDQMGRSPMHLCLSNILESVAVFEQLLRLDLSVIGVNISKSGDSLLTLAMNQPNEDILKLLLQAIPNNSTMLFLISQHKDASDQTALERAFGSIDKTPKRSQLIISLAHILGQLDTPSWTFRFINEGNISAFRTLLDVDCTGVINSTKTETQNSVLKELALIDYGNNVLDFLDALRNAVTTRRISVYEQLVTILPIIITSGKIELLKVLSEFPEVDQVCRLTSLTEDGTLLHHAIALNQSETVQILLPISTNAPNGKGYYPIHMAILTGNAMIADLVLTQFKEPDIPGPNGQTAMHIAIQHAHPTIISRLTAHGASASIADSDGLYPLHLASKAKQPESVHALIVAGARGDCVTSNGLTPLLLTLQSYDSITSSQLIAQLLNAPGTDLYMSDNEDKNTALHIAVAKGNVSVVRFMYEAASPTSPGSSSFPQNQGIGRLRSPWEVHNTSGWTPGHVAVISGHPTNLVCELLSLCDADVLNTLSSGGQTILDLIYEQEPRLSDSMIKSIRHLGARRACELSSKVNHTLQVKPLDDENQFYSFGNIASNQKVAAVSLNQVTGDDVVVAYLNSNMVSKIQHGTDNIETSNSQWSDQMAEDPVAAYLAASNLPMPSTKEVEPITSVSKSPVSRLDVDNVEMNDLKIDLPTNVSTLEIIYDQSKHVTQTTNRIVDIQTSDGEIFESARELFIGDEIMRKYHEQSFSTADSYSDESKNKMNPSPSQICPPEMTNIFQHETEMKDSEKNSNARVLEEVINGNKYAVSMSDGDIEIPQIQEPQIGIDVRDAQHGAETPIIDSKTATELVNKSNIPLVGKDNLSSRDIDNQDYSSIKLPSSTELSINMDAVEMRDLVEEFGLTELIHRTDSDQSNPKAVESKNNQSSIATKLILSEPSTYEPLSKSQWELSEKLKILSKEELELIEMTRKSVINRDMHLKTLNEECLNEPNKSTKLNSSTSQSLSIDMNDDITGTGDELLIRLPSSANLSRVSHSVAADHQVPENVELISRLQEEEHDIIIQMEKEFPMQLHHSRNLTSDTEASVDISEIDRNFKAGQGL